LVCLALGVGGGWWYGRATAPAASILQPELSSSQREAMEEFVNRYFGSWSARDLDTYGRCFHPNARIWFGTAESYSLPSFLDSQRQAHASSPNPMVEVPLSWNASMENGMAHVRVHWELRAGPRIERGYDFFTLVYTEGRWQIMMLIFNEE
jgi:hypothetical protein